MLQRLAYLLVYGWIRDAAVFKVQGHSRRVDLVQGNVQLSRQHSERIAVYPRDDAAAQVTHCCMALPLQALQL